MDENHQVLEFPSHLLPAEVYVGCVVNFTMEVRPEDQKERLHALSRVFDAIEEEASSEKRRARRRKQQRRSKKTGSSKSRSSRSDRTERDRGTDRDSHGRRGSHSRGGPGEHSAPQALTSSAGAPGAAPPPT